MDLVSGADTTFHSSFLFGSHPLLLLLRSVIVPIPPLAILSLERTECVLDFLESLNEKKGNSERWLESIFLFLFNSFCFLKIHIETWTLCFIYHFIALRRVLFLFIRFLFALTNRQRKKTKIRDRSWRIPE